MTALVEQSLSSARWVVQDSTFSDDETERRATGISQASKMPLSLCRFIARRGITSQTLDNFLEPRLGYIARPVCAERCRGRDNADM